MQNEDILKELFPAPSSEPEKQPFQPNVMADYTQAGVKNSLYQDLQTVKAAKVESDKDFVNKLKLGMVDVRYEGGLNYTIDTTNVNNLSRSDFGDNANDIGMRAESSVGFGEENLSTKKYRTAVFDNRPFSLTADDMEARYFEMLGNSFKFGLGESSYEQSYADMQRTLAHKDPAWNSSKVQEALDTEVDSSVKALLLQGGVDPSQTLMASNNRKHFEMILFDAVKTATVNLQMKAYEETHGFIAKGTDLVANMVQDPTLVRDMAVTTAMTGGLALPQLIGARMAAGGATAARLGGATIAGMDKASKAYRAARMSAKAMQAISPTTGIVEGLAYPVFRGALPFLGTNARTITSRALAIGTEGAVAGAAAAARDQRDLYEWKELLSPTGKGFHYDGKEILSAGVMGFGAGLALMGTMRAGFGLIGGEGRLFKARNWDELGKRWANSFDTWAQTKDGLTIFGDTLSDGRGMWFGNALDRMMAKYADNRTFADVMLNGHKLFNNFKFDPRMAAKQNFDDAGAREIATRFEQLTGLPAEVMTSGIGDTKKAASVFTALIDPDVHAMAGISPKDVTSVLDELIAFGESVKLGEDGAAGLVESAARRQADVLDSIEGVFEGVVQAKLITKAGLDMNDVLSAANTALGRQVDRTTGNDRESVRAAATFLLGEKNGNAVAKSLGEILSQDSTALVDGVSVNNARDTLVAALGLQGRDVDNPLWITDGNFVLRVAAQPDNAGNIKYSISQEKASLEAKDGKLSAVTEAEKFSPSYKPENIMSMERLQEKLAEFKSKVADEVKKLKEAQRAAKKATLSPDVVKDIGRIPTHQVLMRHFSLTSKEARVASIVMDAMGYDATDSIIKIARARKDLEEGATGDIRFNNTESGFRALIRTTEHSDFGTLVHEMAHYARVMFISDTAESAEFRKSIGISDKTWKQFLDWVGNQNNDWSGKNIAAEEKFANGFAFFVRNLMQGQVKAPTTGVQRLFVALGRHMGDIGLKMKTQIPLEEGMQFSPIAEEVYGKLISMNDDKLSIMFDTAYSHLFKTLSADDREVVGKTVLGEAGWENYKAQKQIKTEKATAANNPIVAAAAIPKAEIDATINQLVEATKASRVRGFIRQAVVSGKTQPEIIQHLDDAVAIDDGLTERNLAGTPITTDEVGGGNVVEATNANVAFLSDASISNLLTRLESELEFYVVVGYELDPELVAVKPNIVRADSGWLTSLQTVRRDRKVKAAQRAKELRETRAAMKAAASARYVDSAGIPVPLTATEKLAVEARESIVASVQSTEIVAVNTAIAAADETVPLETVASVAETPVAVPRPETINVEQVAEVSPAAIQTVSEAVQDLQRRVNSASKTLSESEKELAAVASRIVANNPLALPNLRKYLTESDVLINNRIPAELLDGLVEYIKLESRFLIAKDALRSITGKADEASLETYSRITLAIAQLGDQEFDRTNTSEFARILGVSTKDVEIYEATRKELSRSAREIKNKLDVAFIDRTEASVAAGKKLDEKTAGMLKAAKDRVSQHSDSVADVSAIPEPQKPLATSHIASAAQPPNSERLNQQILEGFPSLVNGLLKSIGKNKTTEVMLKLYSSGDVVGMLSAVFGMEKLSNNDLRAVIDAWSGASQLPEGAPTIDFGQATATFKRIAKNAELDEFRRFGEKNLTGDGGREESAPSRTALIVDDKDVGLNRAMVWGSLLAGAFHNYLLLRGDRQLAEYFAVRRSTYFIKGNKAEIAKQTYSTRFGNYYGTTKLNELESKLKTALSEYAEELELEDLEGPAELLRKSLGKKDADPFVIFGSGKEFGEAELVFNQKKLPIDRYAEILAGSPIKNNRELDRIVAYRIATGEDTTVADSLRFMAKANMGWHSKLAKSLLNLSNTDALETDAIFMLDTADTAGEIGIRVNILNIVAISPKASAKTASTVLHEAIHTITSDAIKSVAPDLEEKTGLDYLNAVRAIAKQFRTSTNPVEKAVANLAYIYASVIKSMPLRDMALLNQTMAVPRDEYFRVNMDEMLAYALTDKKFAKALSNTTLGNAAMVTTDWIQSLVELSTNKNVKGTLLTEIASIVDDISTYGSTYQALPGDVAASLYEIGVSSDLEYYRVQNGQVFTAMEIYAKGLDPRIMETDLASIAIDPMLDQINKARSNLSSSKGRQRSVVRLVESLRFNQKVLKDEDVTVVGGQLGSNLAKQVQDKQGNKFYVKNQKTTLHAEIEVLGQKLYEMVGIKSVASEVYDTGLAGIPGPALVTPWFTSKVDYSDENSDHVKAVHKAFIPACWLAHWDVCGLTKVENIDGNGVILDAGGSLLFRAQGQPKGSKFGNEVGELESLLNPSINATTAKAFAGLSHAEKANQAKALKGITDEMIDLAVDSHILSSKTEAANLKKILKARRDYIYDKLVGPEVEAEKVSQELYDALNAALGELDPLGIPDLPIEPDLAAVSPFVIGDLESYLQTAGLVDEEGFFTSTEININDSASKVWKVLKEYTQNDEIEKVKQFKDLFVEVILDAYAYQYVVSKDNAILNAVKKALDTDAVVVKGKTVNLEYTDISDTFYNLPSLVGKFFMMFPNGFEGMEGLPGGVSFKLPEDDAAKAQLIDKNIDVLSIADFWKNVEPLISNKEAFKTLVKSVSMYDIIDKAFTLQAEMTPIDAIKTAAKEVYGAAVDTEKVKVTEDPPLAVKLSRVALLELYLSAFNEDPKIFFKKEPTYIGKVEAAVPVAESTVSEDELDEIAKLFDPVEGLIKKLDEVPFREAYSFQGRENKTLGRLRPGQTLLPGLNREQSELVLQIATSPRTFEFEGAFPDILLLTRLVKQHETLRTLVKAYLKERETAVKTRLAGFKADTGEGYNILNDAREFFAGAFQNGYPIDIAIRVFAGNLERADTKLFRVEAGKIPGIALEVFSGDSAADRKLAFQAFSTGKSGNDILVRDELGVPLKLVRAMTDTSMKELDTRSDVKFRSQPRGEASTTYRFFGEEDAQVADDYKDSNHPIVIGYLAVEPERLVRIRLAKPSTWSSLPVGDVMDGIRNSKLPDRVKEATVEKLANSYGGKISIDTVAEILVGGGHADAISVDGTLDLLKSLRNGKLIPHTQWIVATEKNVFKSVTALKFKTGGIPSYFSQRKIGPTGPRAIAIKEEADKLSAATEVHRAALKSLGLNEEITPDEIEALSNIVNGLPTGGIDIKAVVQTTRARRRYDKPRSSIPTKAWRALPVEERRLFLQDHILPKIAEVVGNRNQTAGVYSKLSDSVVGRKFNEIIAGAVSYGDVTDSQSQALQFLGKLLDPASDLRDGELGNAFYMPNVDQIHAEANNMMISSGLADVRQQMMQVAKTAQEAEQINDTAWLYLANPNNVPQDTPHRQVVMNLIEAQVSFNEQVLRALQEAGMIGEGMDPGDYGTIRRADTTAYDDPNGFADALTQHAIDQTRKLKEISVLTCDAMGWLEIRRSGAGEDDILSITVKADSPLASLFSDKELNKAMEWDSSTKQKFTDISKLPEEVQVRHDNALVDVTSDYTEGWRKMYAGKPKHTALRQAMTIARDRYLGYDLTDTKTLGPRQLSMGSGRNYLEERILSHAEITANPALSKYFDKDLADLNYSLIRGQVTEALMTKRLTDFFGLRLTLPDLVEVLRGAEASKDVKLDMAQMESRSRGFDRIRDVWNHNIGSIESSKDSLDKYYKSLLENSRVSVLLMSGLRAGVASSGEVVRALFSSDKHRTMMTQALPNFVKLVQLSLSKNKRRSIQELTSATHWMRGLSTEHLLARADMHPENPFGGVVMGARQPGFFARFMQDWRAVGRINARTPNKVTKVMNRVSMASKYLGGPLALLNDVTTTMHLWNLQRNLTDNVDNFQKLSAMLDKGGTKNVSEFKTLAKKAGLTHREAIALSTQGLLNPKYVKLMALAASDQRNYTDGLLDVRKLYRWAGTDQDRLETISRMGGFVNMTARETNADPTLLDIRIAQSPYARAINVFQQFLLSHSVQEIGRRRRWGTVDYSKHLIGLVAMEMMVTSLLNAYDPDTGEWEWTKAKEDPIEFIISSAIRMPLLGGYQWLTSVLTPAILWGKDLVMGDETDDTNLTLPAVMDSPANRAPRNAWNTVTSMLED